MTRRDTGAAILYCVIASAARQSSPVFAAMTFYEHLNLWLKNCSPYISICEYQSKSVFICGKFKLLHIILMYDLYLMLTGVDQAGRGKLNISAHLTFDAATLGIEP